MASTAEVRPIAHRDDPVVDDLTEGDSTRAAVVLVAQMVIRRPPNPKTMTDAAA